MLLKTLENRIRLESSDLENSIKRININLETIKQNVKKVMESVNIMISKKV